MNASKTLLQSIKSHFLVIATISSVVLGVIVGVSVRATSKKPWSDRDIMYLNFIGEIFLRILKSLILPLIVTSLITGIASLNLSLSRKIGGRAVAFYLTTTFLSVVLGITLVSVIQPGVGHETKHSEDAENSKVKKITTVDTLLDLLRNMCPPNIIQACIEQTTTELTPPKNNINSTDIYEYEINSSFVAGTNIMGVVVISTVLGIAMSILQSEVTYLITIVEEFYRLIMKLTGWAITLSPIGIFFLVVSQIIKMENVEGVVVSLGYYFLTVLAGCVIQGFVILPIIYLFFTRKNPYQFIRGLLQALITAFGTSSSSATMPITLRCIIENNNVNENIAKFMLPIGSAINMDGTALYEAVAAIFIAQLRNVDLPFGKLVAISITATAASIGAAGIPSAGLVTMIMVLETVGLPAKDVTLILAVDWLLDRIRTVINVMGDAFGAGIINHCCRNDILEFNNQINADDMHVEVDPLKTFSINNSTTSFHRVNPSNISIRQNVNDKHAVIDPLKTFSNNRSTASYHRVNQSNISTRHAITRK